LQSTTQKHGFPPVAFARQVNLYIFKRSNIVAAVQMKEKPISCENHFKDFHENASMLMPASI